MSDQKLSIASISIANIKLLDQFIATYKDDKGHFRYFETRDSAIISNHLATFILLADAEPIGYGHLDKEGERVWLGIAIKTEYQGYGMGKLMMQMLIAKARLSGVDKVHLSVDSSNTLGIRLYEKFGFTNDKIDDDKRRMVWVNPS